MVDLKVIFQKINDAHFDSRLPLIELKWNSRLRVSAGRFFPGKRKYLIRPASPPVIEIASYLSEEVNGIDLIEDTLAHEMIHYWLWFDRKPYGHTPEFYFKMKEMGVSRYNPVPRERAHKYIYACPSCEVEFKARRKWKSSACFECCKKYSMGYFDKKFILYVKKSL